MKKKFFKRILAMTVAVAVTLSLWGCGSSQKDLTLTAVLPSGVATLDPQTATGTSATIVIGSIFEGLCKLGDDSKALPGVATRWEHNKECTQFTFHLRNARWSNGDAVTADDFVFGITRALRHDTGAGSLDDLFIIKNAEAFYNGEVDESELGCYAKNEKTLVIELESGYADFPLLTTGNHYMPCNREYFEACTGHYGLSGEYIITNGPFTLPHIYAWDTDYNERSITLTASDTYRGEYRTDVASLTYLIDYDDKIDEDPVGALVGGEVDILQLDEDAARSAEEQGCGIIALENGVTGLLLNPECESLSYVRTRELFIKTLNRAELIELAANEAVNEAMGIMPECVRRNGEDYYKDGIEHYAMQDDSIVDIIPSLKSLLELDRIPSITVLCADDEVSISIANKMLMVWNDKLGNAFNIQPVSEAELKSRVAAGDYEAALYTLSISGVTPFDMFNLFDSTAYPTLLADDDYDSALHEASFNTAACDELEQMIMDEYVFYPLFTAKTYYALAPKLSKITVSPDLRVDFTAAVKR